MFGKMYFSSEVKCEHVLLYTNTLMLVCGVSSKIYKHITVPRYSSHVKLHVLGGCYWCFLLIDLVLFLFYVIYLFHFLLFFILQFIWERELRTMYYKLILFVFFSVPFFHFFSRPLMASDGHMLPMWQVRPWELSVDDLGLLDSSQKYPFQLPQESAKHQDRITMWKLVITKIHLDFLRTLLRVLRS